MCPIKRRISRIAHAATAALCVAAAAGSHAGPREQAKRMHDRLVGVPPSEAMLASMDAKIAAGDAVGAAIRGDAESQLLQHTRSRS